MSYRGDRYVGFAVLVGFSFPGGNDIEHDPTVSTDALVITPASAPPGLAGLFVAVFAILVVLFLILMIVSTGRSRRK